jgi:integration host factor subunit beta
MRTVTKRDLIDRIAQRHPALKKCDIAEVVGGFMDAVSEALVNNRRIELRDFGVFTPKIRKPRLARNPKTGEKVTVAARRVCGFRAGKELKARLAASYKPEEEEEQRESG